MVDEVARRMFPRSESNPTIHDSSPFDGSVVLPVAAEGARPSSAERPAVGAVRVFLMAWLSIVATPLLRGEVLTVPTGYPSIQVAIDAAESGDEILVAAGVYSENLRFWGKSILVRAIDGPALTRVEAAVPGSVVRFSDGETPQAVLRGFTLAGGTGHLGLNGGGISIVNAAPTIESCRIEDNTASNGAGVSVTGALSAPTLRDCHVVNNQAVLSGGGLAVDGGVVQLENCHFEGNHAGLAGGGFSIQQSTGSQLLGCSFVGNSSTSRGGGGTSVNGGIDIALCRFESNQSALGAGLFVQGAVVEASFTTWYANISPALGAAIRGEGGASLSLFRCTLASNVAVDDESAISLLASSLVGSDCIIWANGTDPIGWTGVSTCAFTYSDVEGGFVGEGNFDQDPSFVDLPAGDLRLLPGSPCIDAGNPDGPPDDDGSLPDVGARPFLLDGTPAFRRGDCDGDGALNIADAVSTLVVLFAAGPSVPCEVACDSNDDDVLNVADAINTLTVLFVSPLPFGVDPLEPCTIITGTQTFECANPLSGCP